MGIRTVLPSALILLTACNNPPSEARSGGRTADRSQATSVYSRANEGYVRSRNIDGSFQPESYILVTGEGRGSGGSKDVNAAGNLSFEYVSREIATPLSLQNFVPSDDPATADLRIVVYWGTTVGPDGAHVNGVVADRVYESMIRTNGMHRSDFETSTGLEGRQPSPADALKAAAAPQKPQETTVAQDLSNLEAAQDARIDSENAAILGYTEAIVGAPTGDPDLGGLKSEIEQHRYYVVLLAYDYQAERNQGLHKLLWETRFSIPERGNDFRGSIRAMAVIASRYFGQDSHGLIREDLKAGHVEIGEPSSLGTLP